MLHRNTLLQIQIKFYYVYFYFQTDIPQVISVANGSSLPAASGIDPSLISDNTLHLELEVDPDSVQDSAGQFDIICSFGSTTVALSESFDNVLLYTRFGFPTVTNISPVEALISDVGEVRFSYNVWHMSHLVRKLTMWFLNRSNTNQALQSQKMTRGWKFRI